MIGGAVMSCHGCQGSFTNWDKQLSQETYYYKQ